MRLVHRPSSMRLAVVAVLVSAAVRAAQAGASTASSTTSSSVAAHVRTLKRELEDVKTLATIHVERARLKVEEAKAGVEAGRADHRTKLDFIAAVHDRMQAKLDGKKAVVDSLEAEADAALAAWAAALEDGKGGDVVAQVDAAKLAILDAAVAQEACALFTTQVSARALGLLPNPLAPAESRRVGKDKVRARRALLQAGRGDSASTTTSGRTLLGAAPPSTTTLAELAATLATQALPTCCSLPPSQQPSQANAQAAVRAAVATVPIATAWQVPGPPGTGAGGPTLTDFDYTSMARAYAFPCLPNTAAPNAALVQRLLPLDAWMNATAALFLFNGPKPMGRAMQNGSAGPLDPAVRFGASAAQVAADLVVQQTIAYAHFLELVGRYPFFCGEAGVYNVYGGGGGPTATKATFSLADTCKRELASFFGNAAQESATSVDAAYWAALPANSGYPYVPYPGGKALQAFGSNREGSCYTQNCTGYNPKPTGTGPYCGATMPCAEGCTVQAGEAPGKRGYYGRGYHQTSYWFNYWLHGQALHPSDPRRFVARPDDVAFYPYESWASAVSFAMVPQPPKPSLHEIIIGAYTPPDAVYGNDGSAVESPESGSACTGKVNVLTDLATKVVKNQFMVATNAINGAVECSNGAADARAQNRAAAYKFWLERLGATLTADEAQYVNAQIGPTGCNICRGNAFTADPNPKIYAGTPWKPIGWQPRMNLGVCQKADAGCGVGANGAPKACGLLGGEDTATDKLTYGAIGQAGCTAPPDLTACACGTGDPNVACPCCKMPPVLAISTQAPVTCKGIVSGLRYA